jgi:hypothetical protein
VYVPAGDFSGTDSFSYKVNDGTADSAVATVTITVNAQKQATPAVVVVPPLAPALPPNPAQLPAASDPRLADPPEPGAGAQPPRPASGLPGPDFGMAPLGEPVDIHVPASNLSSNLVPLAPGGASTTSTAFNDIFDLNALPPTGAGPSEQSGFPLERSGFDPAALVRDSGSSPFLAGHRLFVYHGIPDMELALAGPGFLAVPLDAFAHTDPNAIVVLEARLANGLPLPSWLTFSGVRGTFAGVPPEGMQGSLDIEVVARDRDGREARTRFVLRLDQLGTPQRAANHDVADIVLGLDVDAKEKEKARLEAARQAAARQAEQARLPGHKPGESKPPLAPAASFTDQVRAAKAVRDPLLDRIAARAVPDAPGPRR